MARGKPLSAQHRAKISASRTRHGHTKALVLGEARDRTYHTRTYRSWEMMISQCEHPTISGWALHGGRGVKVCPRWRQDFTNFLADMGKRPDGMSVRRVNPLGDYEPGNTYWAPSSRARPEGIVRRRLKRVKKAKK